MELKLSLDWDFVSHGEDELFEIFDEAEIPGLVEDYIHHHASRITEMAGVEDISEVDDPTRFVVVHKEDLE